MNLIVVVITIATLPLLLFNSCTEARPQDLATGMLLAVAQAKQLVETGAAAHKEQEIEVFGQKMGGAMDVGFGDAMNQANGRRRRRSLQSELQHLTNLYSTLAWLKQ